MEGDEETWWQESEKKKEDGEERIKEDRERGPTGRVVKKEKAQGRTRGKERQHAKE